MPTIQFFCVICGTALQGNADARDDVIECHSCAHQVPVPRLVQMPDCPAGCAPVFPPDVLALEVKFLCGSCRSPLRADARWEGRHIACPVCKDSTRIPQWSKITPVSHKASSTKPAKAAELSEAARLSPEEIEFLSLSSPFSPEAAT